MLWCHQFAIRDQDSQVKTSWYDETSKNKKEDKDNRAPNICNDHGPAQSCNYSENPSCSLLDQEDNEQHLEEPEDGRGGKKMSLML